MLSSQNLDTISNFKKVIRKSRKLYLITQNYNQI